MSFLFNICKIKNDYYIKYIKFIKYKKIIDNKYYHKKRKGIK